MTRNKKVMTWSDSSWRFACGDVSFCWAFLPLFNACIRLSSNTFIQSTISESDSVMYFHIWPLYFGATCQTSEYYLIFLLPVPSNWIWQIVSEENNVRSQIAIWWWHVRAATGLSSRNLCLSKIGKICVHGGLDVKEEKKWQFHGEGVKTQKIWIGLAKMRWEGGQRTCKNNSHAEKGKKLDAIKMTAKKA